MKITSGRPGGGLPLREQRRAARGRHGACHGCGADRGRRFGQLAETRNARRRQRYVRSRDVRIIRDARLRRYRRRRRSSRLRGLRRRRFCESRRFVRQQGANRSHGRPLRGLRDSAHRGTDSASAINSCGINYASGINPCCIDPCGIIPRGIHSCGNDSCGIHASFHVLAVRTRAYHVVRKTTTILLFIGNHRRRRVCKPPAAPRFPGSRCDVRHVLNPSRPHVDFPLAAFPFRKRKLVRAVFLAKPERGVLGHGH
mmetsp:Transcript_13149/g.49182  ORF Transcript_13149/g.49182 Transcript_13149/m.49182 type:complete len:256 (-) Transcript_13149:1973-2740(-)